MVIDDKITEVQKWMDRNKLRLKLSPLIPVSFKNPITQDEDFPAIFAYLANKKDNSRWQDLWVDKYGTPGLGIEIFKKDFLFNYYLSQSGFFENRTGLKFVNTVSKYNLFKCPFLNISLEGDGKNYATDIVFVLSAKGNSLVNSFCYELDTNGIPWRSSDFFYNNHEHVDLEMVVDRLVNKQDKPMCIKLAHFMYSGTLSQPFVESSFTFGRRSKAFLDIIGVEEVSKLMNFMTGADIDKIKCMLDIQGPLDFKEALNVANLIKLGDIHITEDMPSIDFGTVNEY